MSLWYYAKGDQQRGPISREDLKLLAETGVLLPTDLVWQEGESNRRPAANLKNLFPEAPRGQTLIERLHPEPPAARAESPRVKERQTVLEHSRPEPARVRAEPPRVKERQTLLEPPHPEPARVREDSPQVKEGPGRRSGPTVMSVASVLVAMFSILLGGGASYLYWSNTQRPLVLPTALLGLLLGNLVLLFALRGRARFSLSVLGVTASTAALTTAFVDAGGLSKFSDDARRAITGVAKSESAKPAEAPRPAQAAEAAPPGIQKMTKQELIAKIEALGNPCSRSDLFAAVGEPQQKRVEDGQRAGLFWTWECRDGKVEVVLLNPDVGAGEHTDKAQAYISMINER
jgi:hypothetical protein